MMRDCVTNKINFSCIIAGEDKLNQLAEKLEMGDAEAEAMARYFSPCPSEAQVTFSTVHAYKGAEANTVAVHPDIFYRSQSTHVQNVALTRAQKLLLVPSEVGQRVPIV
jgi:superfamily I DNA/RNA helicase